VVQELYNLNKVVYHELLMAKVEPVEAAHSTGSFSRRSSIRYFLGTVPKAEPSLPLSVPREIAAQLGQNGIAVLFGAPASGKTEQMELAIPSDQLEAFDLFDRFCEAYSAMTGLNKNEIVLSYLLSGSEIQRELKEAQKNWLREERQSILDELLLSEKPVILFDEFDFCGGFDLSSDEADAAVSIVQIGEELRKSGKQVVFIIHDSGNSCAQFWEEMEESFGYSQQESVKTHFFSWEEEIYLLSQTSLSPEEKQTFMEFAKGSPTAYLPILKSKFDLSLDQLESQALLMSQIVLQYNKQTYLPEVWETLQSVAQGLMALEDVEDPFLISHLLATSFVGDRDGFLLMPDFAKEVLA
jgi:hypothetical protein